MEPSFPLLLHSSWVRQPFPLGDEMLLVVTRQILVGRRLIVRQWMRFQRRTMSGIVVELHV
jgi:hypothetical protein